MHHKFSAYNFGNWDFQGDSVASFTRKVIFSRNFGQPKMEQLVLWHRKSVSYA